MAEYSIIVENLMKNFNLTTGQHNFRNLRNLLHGEVQNKLIALNDISFNVSKGEMMGIIGLNGSGKTTLLRTIAGIYVADKGNIQIKGLMAPLLHIGTGFNNELNAKENITLYGMLLGVSKPDITSRIKSIIEYAELENFSEMKLLHYSSGMRARLAFSTALQINPDILLVDEILSVGDIAFRKKSFNSFLSFKEKGKTILFATHNLGSLSKMCDRVMLLEKGKLIAIGKPEEIVKLYQERSQPKAKPS